MNRWILLTALLVTANGYGATHTVKMLAMSFDPAILKVKKGDKVTWINNDIATHSASSLDNTFNSRSVRPKKKWSYTADAVGEHDYKCIFHTGMKGKLIVE